MGYLNEAFDTYYNSIDDKQRNNIKKGFKEIVWGSLPYTKLDRFFKYKISYNNIADKKALEIFERHKFIEYRVLKSRYNINGLGKEDLIKARINSNYGKYFDKEVYFKKEYYRALAQYKNIYFNYLKGEIDDLENKILENDRLVKRLKKESLDNKHDMEWEDYKLFINMCFDKIFNNYKPIDNKIKEGVFNPNHIMDWDEDNYILGYVNKSLNGYLKNYIKEITDFDSKYKWKCSLNKYLKIEDIKNKYTPLQLCVGRYYKTKEDLLKVSDDNVLKLTKTQRKLIKQIKEIIDNHNEKEIILFNEHGTPYINQAFLSKYTNDKYKWNIITIIEIIYNRINSKNKYCINCGKIIKAKSNKTKYCKTCAREMKKEQDRIADKKYKNKLKARK